MARLKNLNPKLCYHKRSGKAYVTICGNQITLGDYGTQQAQDA